MKLLMWLLLAWFALLWVLHLKKLKAARGETSFASASRPAKAAPEIEAMLPCAHCGLHLPASDAITSPDGSLAWCSEEHRRFHPR